MNSNAEDAADLSVEGNPLLITSGGVKEANPLERLAAVGGQSSWRWRDTAIGCSFVCVVVFIAATFSPSSIVPSAPEVFEVSEPKPTLGPINEKILLTSRTDIDNFFEKLNEKRIFFVIVPNAVDHLTKMAMCAVESAAQFNPEYDVVLFQAISGDTKQGTELSGASRSAYDGVLSMKNVYFADLNVSDALEGTIVEEWWHSTLSKVPKYRNQHIANTLRFSFIYDYGGFYSDTDAIFFKSIANFSNAIGYEGQHRKDPPAKGYQVVNNAVLAFDRHHPFMGEYLKRWRDEYENERKIKAVTIATVIGANCTDHPNLEYCKGVTFAPPNEFYAINWMGIQHYKQLRDANPEKFDRSFKSQTNNSIAHIWNSFKGNEWPFRQGDVSTTNDMYGALMHLGCPFVFDHQTD